MQHTMTRESKYPGVELLGKIGVNYLCTSTNKTFYSKHEPRLNLGDERGDNLGTQVARVVAMADTQLHVHSLLATPDRSIGNMAVVE